MPGPVIADPTPAWLKPENASVTDSSITKALRMIGHLIGADNPTSQVLGLMMSEIPSGPSGGLAGAVGRLMEKGKAITAYHGSPHDFERFSMEKIGTGEGAQAYGHGLYFAENPAVAAEYRNDLTQRPITVAAGKPLTQVQQRIVDYLSEHNVPLDDQAIMSVGDAMTSAPFDVGPRNQQTWNKWKAAFEELRPRLSQVEKPGRTYEVAIHADPESFLDWDKPLNQQSEKVQRAIAQLPEAARTLRHPLGDPMEGTPLGKEVYEKLSDVLAAERHGSTNTAIYARHTTGEASKRAEEASRRLLDQAGIPGIKYLDQGSRAAGEGSRNYVVFDDSLVQILKKYGIAVPVIEGLRYQAQQQNGVLHKSQLEGLTQ